MFGDPVTNSLGRKQVPFADFMTDIKYGTSQPPQFSEDGVYKFIRATNIKKGRITEESMLRIDEVEASKIQKCKLNGNEIIIVRSGANTGDTCVVTSEYAGNYAGYDIIITLDAEKANPVYFNELINTHYMEQIVKPLTVRSAQPHLNAKQVQEMPMIVASLEEQNVFAALVEQSDKSKFVMFKSQFIEMFAKYPKKRFGDFCTTHARIGWQKLTKAEFLDEGDYYLVTGWDIMPDHTVAFEQCKYVTKERYEQDSKLILGKGDVLLTKDGTLGKVAIIGDLDKPATLNGHIFVIRPKDERIIPEFLLGLFISDDFINQLDSNKTGSTIKGITQKALLEFEIPIAPVGVQQQYVDFMKQSDKSK